MTDHAESPHKPHAHTEHAQSHVHPEPQHHHEGDGHGHDPAPEAENLPVTQVAMVAFICLLVFAVGGVWAMKIRTDTLNTVNPNGPSALPVHFGAEEQGIVDQIPFELNHWVKDRKAADKSQINAYAWVNRKEQLIRIPIERAMELELADSPAPATPRPSTNAPSEIQPLLSAATTTSPTAPSVPLVPTDSQIQKPQPTQPAQPSDVKTP